MNCAHVDELGAAFALDAVEPDERRAIDEHLASCGEAHADARARLAPLFAVGSLESMTPSAALRERLMATVAATPQDAPAATAVARAPRAPAAAPQRDRSWLDWSGLWRPAALAGIAASLVLAVVAGSLWTRLQDRDAQLRAVADALGGSGAAHAVSGEAASGYLVDTEDGTATLVVASLPALPDGQLYELWLMDADGTPAIAGTHRPSTSDDGVTVIELELDPEGWETFAITVEHSRVDAPTSDPVLIGDLSG